MIDLTKYNDLKMRAYIIQIEKYAGYKILEREGGALKNAHPSKELRLLQPDVDIVIKPNAVNNIPLVIEGEGGAQVAFQTLIDCGASVIYMCYCIGGRTALGTGIYVLDWATKKWYFYAFWSRREPEQVLNFIWRSL